MKLRLDKNLADFLGEIQQTVPGQKVFLVGGAVRDLVIQKPVKDLDFVIQTGSVELARAVRRRFDGVWYTLDDEHQTARVILRQGREDELVLDFTSFIGESLDEDLSNRDFTVNAMAIDLDKLDEVIDPLGGQSDLAAKQLRLTNQGSLQSDPLRVLRAVRMARTFGLAPTSETLSRIRLASYNLNRISGERIRDELLKCLELPGLCETYFLLKDYGILFQLLSRAHKLSGSGRSFAQNDEEDFPDMDDYLEEIYLPDWSMSRGDFTKNPLRILEELIVSLKQENTLPLINQENGLKIEQTAKELSCTLAETLQGGRKREQLLKVFALFFLHHPAFGDRSVKLDCQQFSLGLTNALMFGQKENAFFSQVCLGYINIEKLSRLKKLTALEIYRYFREVGTFGLESALLHNAVQNASITPDIMVLTTIERLILSWFQEHEKVINPPRLIDGDDLKKVLHLKPGPNIGVYLEAVREAQIVGQVQTQDQAMELVREMTMKRGNVKSSLTDIDMVYQDVGTGKPVMLLHGLALDGSIWNDVVNLYADQARFIVPDLRGHGQTLTGLADGTLEQFADDIAALLDQLEINKITLAGHSMGGYIALAFAGKYPQRLAGLAMVTSNARADSPEKRRSRLDDADQVSEAGSKRIADGMAPKLTRMPDLVQLGHQIIAKTPPEGIANVQRAIANRPNRLEVLSHLDITFLAIAGADDQLMQPEVAFEMAEASKHGKAIVLPGIGHLPMWEAPVALGALIVSIL